MRLASVPCGSIMRIATGHSARHRGPVSSRVCIRRRPRSMAAKNTMNSNGLNVCVQCSTTFNCMGTASMAPANFFIRLGTKDLFAAISTLFSEPITRKFPRPASRAKRCDTPAILASATRIRTLPVGDRFLTCRQQKDSAKAGRAGANSSMSVNGIVISCPTKNRPIGRSTDCSKRMTNRFFCPLVT